MHTNIKLARGEEIVINGYIIRAVGADIKRPNQLSIRKRGWPMLWAGYCDTVLTSSSIIVGDHSEALPDSVRITNVYSYTGNADNSPTRLR